MTVVEYGSDVIVGMCKCGNPCLPEEVKATELDDDDELVICSCKSCKGD